MLFCTSSTIAQTAKLPFMPSQQELSRPFGKLDEASFLAPPKVYHPETWFHFIGGNVSKEGITKDLEAIAKAGFSGIMLFGPVMGGSFLFVNFPFFCCRKKWPG